MHTLSHYIRTYDAALPADWCNQLVKNFEELKKFQQPNGAGVRPGLETSAWTEIDIGRIADASFFDSMDSQMLEYFERYNRDVGLSLGISPPKKRAEFIVKRYRANLNESFQLHFDALGAVSNRYLVFLWYLNDLSEGGTTDFPDLNVSIEPKAGRLLMFPPYWMFQHTGTPPKSGDKFIMSTYLTY
jgi:prolyl 4-hydroxylase